MKIFLTNSKVQIRSAKRGETIDTAFNLLLNATLNLMRKAARERITFPETSNGESFNQLLEASKKEVYDHLNQAFSNVLYEFAPEIDQHPDLTAEAIMHMEDYILAQKWDELSPEERAERLVLYDQQIVEMTEALNNKQQMQRGASNDPT